MSYYFLKKLFLHSYIIEFFKIPSLWKRDKLTQVEPFWNGAWAAIPEGLLWHLAPSTFTMSNCTNWPLGWAKPTPSYKQLFGKLTSWPQRLMITDFLKTISNQQVTQFVSTSRNFFCSCNGLLSFPHKNSLPSSHN